LNSWFDGIRIDEIAFYEDFMQEQPLLFVDGIFYSKDGTISEQGFKFTLSVRTRKNIMEMKEENCSVVGFLADTQFVSFGFEFECSTADLYYGYCHWCRLNGVTFIKQESFSTWMKHSAEKYGLVYDRYVVSVGSTKKARGYRGIKCLYRVCVV